MFLESKSRNKLNFLPILANGAWSYYVAKDHLGVVTVRWALSYSLYMLKAIEFTYCYAH